MTYNELNLPETIDFSGNSRIQYDYDALGTKRRQTTTESGRKVKTIDFIGNFVYENDYPAYHNFDEGRIVHKSDVTCFAETHLKDHLGNVRVAYTVKDGIITLIQSNAYYPFGMNIKELSKNNGTDVAKYYSNEFKYNGKMFQDEIGLNWYDYGARFYDPVIGRWHSVDPLAEKYRRWSPYNYCVDNPMRFVDPDGMAITDIWNIRTHKRTHIEDGKNDQKIELSKGQLIDAPSKETTETYKQMFKQGEKSGKEQLIVSGDNGVNSKIVEGENGNHLNSENFIEARVDLISKGGTPTSDAHYHPNETDKNGNITVLGAATPSGTDMEPKNNIGNTRPNVVLGYYDKSIPDPNKIGGTTPIIPVRAIGFYNTSGPFGNENGYNFDKFCELIYKIYSTNE